MRKEIFFLAGRLISLANSQSRAQLSRAFFSVAPKATNMRFFATTKQPLSFEQLAQEDLLLARCLENKIGPKKEGYDKAEQAYKDLIRKYPHHEEAYNHLLQFWVRLGGWQYGLNKEHLDYIVELFRRNNPDAEAEWLTNNRSDTSKNNLKH